MFRFGHLSLTSRSLLLVVTAAAAGGFITLAGVGADTPICNSESCPSEATEADGMANHLVNPAARDTHYGGNMAQYLIDLHDARGVFDFCGGMMFQFVLSANLRSHLAVVAEAGEADGRQPVLFGTTADRMAKVPGYAKSAVVDNAALFHGREVRKVTTAKGGMGFVLQLVLAEDDPEGWTHEETAGYDGWDHDGSRTWRDGERLKNEGYTSFGKFGATAYTLNHRFYLHLDRQSRVWLAAEDGCEGTPAAGQST